MHAHRTSLDNSLSGARPQSSLEMRRKGRQRKSGKRKRGPITKTNKTAPTIGTPIPSQNHTPDVPRPAKRQRSHQPTRTTTSSDDECVISNTADTARFGDETEENDDAYGGDDDDYDNSVITASNRGPRNRKKGGKWSPLEEARLRAWQRENKLPEWMVNQLQGARTERAVVKRLRKLEQIDMLEDQMWFSVEKVLDCNTDGGVTRFLVRWEDTWVEEQDIDPGLIRAFEEERSRQPEE
jgi:hypothetical protein